MKIPKSGPCGWPAARHGKRRWINHNTLIEDYGLVTCYQRLITHDDKLAGHTSSQADWVQWSKADWLQQNITGWALRKLQEFAPAALLGEQVSGFEHSRLWDNFRTLSWREGRGFCWQLSVVALDPSDVSFLNWHCFSQELLPCFWSTQATSALPLSWEGD